MSNRSIYCTFFLDDLLFAIEVRRVEEVILHLPVTRVPLAPPAIEGLINLRGQILVAINLRGVLLQSSERRTAPQTSMVINARNEAFSLQADRYGDVVELEDDRHEPPLETLPVSLRSRLRSVYQYEGRILHVLDLDRVVETHPGDALTLEKDSS